MGHGGDRPIDTTDKNNDKSDKNIEAIARALDIIEKIAFSKKRISIRDIALDTGYSKSSIHRILKTLISKGFVSKSFDDSYALGAKFLFLKSVKSIYESYIEIVTPIADKVAVATCQTVTIHVLNGDKGLCIFKREPDTAVKYVAEVGMPIPLEGGASGKILLAFAPDEVRERILEGPLLPHARNTVTDKKRLRAQIETIRREQLAISREELQENAFSVSVPIFLPSGEFLSQYGIAGAISMLEGNEDFFITEVRRSAKKIQNELSVLWKFDR